ncbi:ubiquitin-specific protease ubp2, partial [Ascosphaera aggregata]
MPFPTYEKALDYLGAEKGTPDDFIISMFTTKLLDYDSPESLNLAREALGVIAEERNSVMLDQYLKTGEISESEMDVGKALALLQSPPEADDSSIMAAYHSCCFDSPERVMEFEKALDVISRDRGRDVRISETDPDSQPKPSTTPPQPARGKPDWPVG